MKKLWERKDFLIRYLMAGASSFVVNMAAMWFFTEVAGLSGSVLKSNLAHFLAAEISIIWGFNAHYFFTWRNFSGDYIRKLNRFHVFAFSSLLLRQFLFFLLTFLGVNYMLATLIPIAIIVVINYLGYEKFIFTSPPT